MKYIYLILLFFIHTGIKVNAQCNIQTLERDDGVTVRYTRPDRIGYCDKFVLGLSMQTNGKDFFVLALCIFDDDAQNLKGDFVIFFDNKKDARLQLYTSEFTTIKGSPATMNIFYVNEKDLKNILNSNIRMATAQLNDGVYQSIKIMVNEDKLKKDYLCLINH